MLRVRLRPGGLLLLLGWALTSCDGSQGGPAATQPSAAEQAAQQRLAELQETIDAAAVEELPSRVELDERIAEAKAAITSTEERLEVLGAEIVEANVELNRETR